MIISSISSYLEDPSQDISDLAKLYPYISFFDERNVKKIDIMNKYFLMFKESKPNQSRDVMDNERRWRAWADDHLVHLISPNVYRTGGEAFETFEWFSKAGQWDENFPKWERNLMVYVGAVAMYLISIKLRQRHGLTDDVRLYIYDACDSWCDQLEKRNTPFMGGDKPNLSDLAVFGVLCSMEGCSAFKVSNIG
jgi:microsomal prostaglandin-E synthase 2